MKKDANDGTRHMFSLVSSYKLTYVLFLDNYSDLNTRATNDESGKPLNLFISQPLGKEKLLRAICFVLAMRYKGIAIENQKSKAIVTLRKDVIDYFNRKNNLIKSKNSNCWNDKEKAKRANSDNIESPEPLEARLLRAWKEKPRKNVIGRGRTGFVVKLDLGGESLALKMVDVFKHAPGAIDKLENEYKVLKLNENKCM